jgi:hypothetical protein
LIGCRSNINTRRLVSLFLVSLHAGYGFINRIEDCNFVGSSIGLKSANQANAVVIANNNFEGQSFAAIVIGNAVGGLIIEGNEMEGIGGPAIIIFGMTNTITIKSNYIATTNEGRVTHGARMD